MVRKNISDLEDNEILAKPVMTWDYQIILQQGATLKKEYVGRLKELGISEVYVKEQEKKTHEISILRSDLENSVKEKVKEILERHTYQHNKELIELSKTADNIIENILEEDKVVEKVYDIQERSADIYEHSISSCSMSILVALKMKLGKSQIHDIGVGCLLHDMGLRYSSQDLVHKPVEDMNDVELTEYKKHPVYGYVSVKEESWISDVSKLIILNHHETLDGVGFPLHTKEIGKECRIVSACDIFDEMICGISRERSKVYEAVEYLKAYKNVKYDAEVVDTLLGFIAVYPAGSRVITNEGETGIVVSQNKEFLNRPVIRIVKDKDGKDVTEPIIKDLVKINHVFIEKVID